MCEIELAVFSPLEIISDKLEITGLFKIVLTDTFVSNLLERAIDKFIATNESPPKSKNESAMLISEHFKRFFNSSKIILSVLFLGGITLFRWLVVGSGKAFLSTLPFILSGKLSKIVICAGII